MKIAQSASERRKTRYMSNFQEQLMASQQKQKIKNGKRKQSCDGEVIECKLRGQLFLLAFHFCILCVFWHKVEDEEETQKGGS